MAARSHGSRSIERPEALRVTLSRDAGEIAALRAAVDDLASRQGLGDRAADVVLALEELVANAQEHGAPPVEVTAWADGKLVVEVSDRGSGLARLSVPERPPSSNQDHGRGLWIVRQLADHMEVRSSAEGTTVRIELSSEPQIGA